MGDTTLVSWAGGREEHGNLYNKHSATYYSLHMLGYFWDDKISLFWLRVWLVVLVRQMALECVNG